jgi:hypothetical protein
VADRKDETQDNEQEYNMLGDDIGEQDTRQVGEGREGSTGTMEGESEGDAPTCIHPYASIQRK